ncbi:energy transducer TonB [Pyxidicoccus caerfyrddinensis]|uniref:energy transducer TonB n=1 Tax=Pyxidicoccus caerfyrddinensis TaxID=2709663 RepID=UPI0013DD18E2|nr:energy transducer TonB [Pyxidicoccus caerfyrddinensis]
MRLLLILCVLVVPGLAASQESRAAAPDAGMGQYLEHFLAQPPGPDDVLPFGASMTRPEQLSGELPKYTPEALAARVEGRFVLQCTIRLTGEVTDCLNLKPLRHMDKAIMDAVKTWRFKPATLKGHPVAVRYTFAGKYTLPAKKR